MSMPEVGSTWFSISNGCGPYVVKCITNLSNTSKDNPPQVVYDGPKGKIWSRPLAVWHQKMKEVKL